MRDLTIPKLGCIIPDMGTMGSAKPKTKRAESPPGIANALFTKVQQRVLAIFFGNPDRSFYANEVIALAESGTGAVQRELIRLAGAGLLTVNRVGKQKHYQANVSAPVFNELRGIVLKTSGLVDVVRAALAPILGEIEVAFVFGSVAKGVDKADSDIDLFVLSERLTYSDIFSVLEDAGTRLGRKINPTLYTRRDLDERLRKENAFIMRILSQPKLWILGSHDDLPT